MDDTQRQVTSYGDTTRHDAPPADKHYILSLEQVAQRFEAAGVPKSMRTLQRYCLQQRLDCLKTETELGVQYFIDEASAERTIKEMLQLHELQMRGRQLTSADVATRHDAIPHDMAQPANINPPPNDSTRHDASRRDMA